MATQNVSNDPRVCGGVWRKKNTDELYIAIGPMDGRGDPTIRFVSKDTDGVLWIATGPDRFNTCAGNLFDDYEFVGMALDMIASAALV